MTPVHLAGRQWHMLAGGGLHWPAHHALLIADLHLGKDATFRAAGIGVPTGGSAATLDRVTTMLNQTRADELFILGDLFHARSSLSAATEDVFTEFLFRHPGLTCTLIVGNHDRHVGRLPDRWGLCIAQGTLHLDGIAMSHFPRKCPPDADLLIAGHLHPGYSISYAAEATGRLPCFWFNDSDHCLTLPACGDFTGMATVRPRQHDQLWVVAEQDVIPIGIAR